MLDFYLPIKEWYLISFKSNIIAFCSYKDALEMAQSMLKKSHKEYLCIKYN